MRTFGKWDIPLFDLKEQKIEPKSLIFAEKGGVYNPEKIQARKTMAKAVQMSRSTQKESKGITVLDFDDTLAQTKSNVLYTMPDGTKGKIDATQFAAQSADLEAQGAVFDFSEFSQVIDGKKGPLADLALKRQGKFGSGDIFVLTARPQASDIAIQKFLKEIGLDLKIANITGLADGTAQAKADWIVGKAADGYNDFYFADDALQNVQAVDNMLEQFDVKRKVQQAKIKLQQAKNNQAQVAESLSLAHKVALSNYLTALHTQKQKTENLELSKKIYLKTMAKYREGLVSSIELSQSGADYSQAQADNAQAIYNLLIAKTNYNRSVGN